MKNISFSLRQVFLLSAIILTSSNSVFAQSVIYVNATSTGANNGTNWQNAFKDIQSALDASKNISNASIWVAKGIYYPTKSENPADPNPRAKTFLITKDVKLLGGFDGTETMECQQDFADNPTILSGDIGVLKNQLDNAYTIVKMRNVSDATILSGFTIRDGNGIDGNTYRSGGGLLIIGNKKVTNPVIEHCVFINNQSQSGGAVYCDGEGKNASPTIIHCTFVVNSATRSGGAINCNSRNGGNSQPNYEDCVFKGNKAAIDGGAIFNDGYLGKIKSNFINCAFIGNGAGRGGAIFNHGRSGSANALYQNCSFSGNIARGDVANKPAQGGAIMNQAIDTKATGSSIDVVLKCILYGNSSELAYDGHPNVKVDSSLVKGGTGSIIGKGNIDKNPRFVLQPPIGLGTIGDLNLKHESDLVIENMGYHEHGWNTDIHWTYSEEELDGPQSWLHLCSAKPGPSSCGGTNQSPIDISTASVANTDTFKLSEEYEQHKITVVNNGHTLEFEADNDTLTLNGAKYVLKQFHFHTPSEHKINGNPYPMEVHFVHMNTTTGLLTVLGVLVEVGPTEHPLLKTFINNLPGKANAKCDNDFEFSIESLLPENRECYQYKGSLTTPPCSEIVNWNVFKTPIKATQSQVDAFKKRESINNRPTQALNGRKIYSGKLKPKGS